MPDRERKRVPDHRSNALKGDLSPWVHLPTLGTRNIRVSEDERREKERVVVVVVVVVGF